MQPPSINADHFPEFVGEPDPALTRRVRLATEDVGVAYEKVWGRECGRVGHRKVGFDIRSLAPLAPQTGYRDLTVGVRRTQVKDCKRGQPVRLTMNGWFKVTAVRGTYWLHLVRDPLDDSDPALLMIWKPVMQMDDAKREVAAVRYYHPPADVMPRAAGDREWERG